MGAQPVDIVLAAYNGAEYIEELLKSLLEQDYPAINIYARDDGSTDGCYEKLCEYAYNNLGFQLIESEKNLGVVKNFDCLLQHTTADYVLLADQDDYWLPGKVSASLAGIKDLEIKNGVEMPALFFTDLEVVDSSLNKMADSFWEYENVRPGISRKLNKLLIRNVSPGCSMIVNRALLNKALPLPEGIVMHDWWLILIAAIFGKVGYSGETTIKYRQHGKNVEGAKNHSIYKKIYNFLFKYEQVKRTTISTQNQAKRILERYGNEIEDTKLEIVKAYCNSRGENRMMHKYRCYMNRISSKDLLSNIALYLVI